MKSSETGRGFFIFGDQSVVIRVRDAQVVAEGTEAECRAEATRRTKADKEDYAVFSPKAIYGRKRDIAVQEIGVPV